MPAPRFLVLVGSVRPRRIGPDVARWIIGIGEASLPAAFELVDLRDWPLPMDDEPDIPAHGAYTQPRTRAWSRKIDDSDGIVFVTPQYNWGYPAALKNAIDHLYAEWRRKPAAIVTYGGHGGGRCATQLREVLTGLELRLAPTMPALVLSAEQVRLNSGSIDAATAFSTHEAAVQAVLRELHDIAGSIHGESASAR